MTALRDVQGIGPSLESQLHEAGYGTVADLAAADPNNLVAVRGIGPVSARQIIAAAADLTSGPRPDPSAPKSTPNAEKEPGGAREAKKKPKKENKKKKNKKKKAKNATAAKKSNTAKAKKTTKKKKKKRNKKA
jgi:Mg-chelatase subunit ChlI